MSIRTKSLLFIGIGLFGIFSLSLFIVSSLFLKQFDTLEKDRTFINLERVSQRFDEEKISLSTKLSDWSTWDDAYDFIETLNPKFIESNLQDLTFENLQIYAMIYAKPGKKIVYSKAFDAEGVLGRTLSESVQKIATSSSLFGQLKKNRDEFTGMLLDENTPFVISARPIVSSSEVKPSNGILIFLRKISPLYIKRFSEIVKLPVQVIPITPENMTEDLSEELENFQENHIENESQTTLEADHFEKDIFGKPALYFHMELPREIHMQGRSLIRNIGIFGTVGALGVLLVVLYVIDSLVLKRLINTSNRIVSIGKKGIISDRLPRDTGSDELSSLTRAVNSMLQSIEYSQHLLSDERYRMQQYIDSAGIMFVAISPKGVVTMVNKKTCEVLERTKDELLGSDWITMTVPEASRADVRTVLSSVFIDTVTGPEYHENLILTKNGSSKLIGWHNSVLRNNEGLIVAAISSGEDITDRKATEVAMVQKNIELESTKSAMLNILEDERKLEEQVKLERDQAQTIISSMNEGIFVVDKSYKIILANAMAGQVTGMDVSDMIGKKLQEITIHYTGTDQSTIEQNPLFKTITTGESYSFGLEDNQYLEGKNGKVPIALATTPLKKGEEIIGGLVTFHDVSKDKIIKETIENEVSERTADLEQEKARFMASIKSLSLGFIMTDITGKVVLINSIAHKIINIPESALSFDDLTSVFKGFIDLKKESDLCTETKQSKQLPSFQYQSRWIRIFLAPVVTQDEHHDVIGQVVILEDVTESKMIERSKDEFFSIASHELRTPLTAIRGNTSMIIDFYKDKLPDSDVKEMIDDIHTSSIRLIEIVNDFLNVSRFEQGKIEFKKTSYALADLISETLSELRMSAQEKNVELTYVDSGEFPNVFADRDRTKQALFNLIGNSLKFTEAGRITVQVLKVEGMLTCTIKDTGRGISKENQPLLFRKFQQAGSSLFTRDTTKGTGLGLYISRLIIEGMGGKIWLEKSEEGVGSEFCFTLPISN